LHYRIEGEIEIIETSEILNLPASTREFNGFLTVIKNPGTPCALV